MKVCSCCKVEREDSCFRARVDKRKQPHLHYLNNQCIECDRKRANRYYAERKNDPEFKRKNVERVKKYRESNSDQIRYRRQSPEYLRKHSKWENKRYHRIRDEISAKMKIRRQTPEYKKKIREYRERKKEIIRQQEVVTKRRYQEKHMANLTDEYISMKLFNRIDREFITNFPDLIEAKRLQILIKRKINSNDKN